MALFERKAEPEDELVVGSDAATRALSVTAVENDFVEARLRQARQVYDLYFGPTLHPGRLQAIQRMNIQPRRARARGRRRHRHQPVALSARLHGHRHRLLGVDAREGARAGRAQGPRATSGCCRWTRPT